MENVNEVREREILMLVDDHQSFKADVKADPKWAELADTDIFAVWTMHKLGEIRMVIDAIINVMTSASQAVEPEPVVVKRATKKSKKKRK